MRCKTGDGHSFLSPSIKRVMKKITGKEGGSQKIATTIVNIRKSWHAIISWHAVQPPLSGHSHFLAIPRRVFFQLSPLLSSCASSAWYTYFGFVSRIRWRKVQSKKDVDAYGPMGSASWLLSGWGVMILIIIRLQLAFILFCFAFFLPAVLWLASGWSITWRGSPLKQHSEV